MSGANSGKAFFTNTDTNAQFQVQFNPKEFKLDEKSNWKASGEHATSKPLLTFEKGEPSTVSMDLIFDTTDNQSDVYRTYVEPLRDFLTADVPVKDEKSGQVKGMRPPYCLFTWGNFNFTCVIEKVSCTFLMFKSDGTPIRAKVQLGLKEHIRENTSFGAGGGVVLTAGALVTGSGANTKTYTTMPGDTLGSVANRFNASPEDIALANNVADGMEFPPNTPLVIPATPELAKVLAQQSLKYTPAYWKSDKKLEPYDVFAVPAGDTAYVPSAFDDEGPVAQDYATPARPEIPYASFNQTYGNYGDSELIGGVFAPQKYGDYGDSDFTFGEKNYQEYGNYGDSQIATGTGGLGIDIGSFEGSDASAFRNDATPDEQGAKVTAQEYGNYATSQEAGGTGGQGIDVGTFEGSDASAFRNDATPDEQGAKVAAQEYGGYATSQEAGGTGGQGIDLGGDYDSAEASSFRNDASPDEQGSRPEGQSYGGYSESQDASGTAGQGAGGYGGYQDSESSVGTAGEGAGSAGGFGPSESSVGTAGQGAGASGGFGKSENASGTAGEGAGAYGGHGKSENAMGTAGEGSGGSGGFGASDKANSFENAASPDGEGPKNKGLGYGGYGNSSDASGTAGEGAPDTAGSSATAGGMSATVKPMTELKQETGTSTIAQDNTSGQAASVSSVSATPINDSSALSDALRRVKEATDKQSKE